MSQTRVLLIDDEEELVTTLVERLELRGFLAEAVTTGHDALERLHGERFDVVVVDLKMPGLGGREIVRLIRERIPGVKTLLVTGHGIGTDEAEEGAVPDTEVLLKPFKLEVLIEKIRNLVAG